MLQSHPLLYSNITGTANFTSPCFWHCHPLKLCSFFSNLNLSNLFHILCNITVFCLLNFFMFHIMDIIVLINTTTSYYLMLWGQRELNHYLFQALTKSSRKEWEFNIQSWSLKYVLCIILYLLALYAYLTRFFVHGIPLIGLESFSFMTSIILLFNDYDWVGFIDYFLKLAFLKTYETDSSV